MKSHQMGEFRDRLTKLRLQAAQKEITWQSFGKLWAKAERQSTGNIFSSVGLSAESWSFTVRTQDLTMADALDFNGYHHFITSIERTKPGFWVIQTARVRIVNCKVRTEDGGASFPAALTEKYIRHAQQLPMAVNTTTFVLVTPKIVDLEEGGLVEVEGPLYEIQIAHRLDDFKNEFEIVRKEDL